MGDARSNDLIREQKHTASKRTKERMRDAWVAMVDMLKEYTDINDEHKRPSPDPEGEQGRPPSTFL